MFLFGMAASCVLVCTACGNNRSVSSGSLPIPGHESPQRALSGLIQGLESHDLNAACSYVVPTEETTCVEAGLPAVSGTVAIGHTAVDGDEALVVTVSSNYCIQGQCYSNDNPDKGLPNGSMTFAQALASTQNNQSDPTTPCQQISGMWYVVAQSDAPPSSVSAPPAPTTTPPDTLLPLSPSYSSPPVPNEEITTPQLQVLLGGTVPEMEMPPNTPIVAIAGLGPRHLTVNLPMGNILGGVDSPASPISVDIAPVGSKLSSATYFYSNRNPNTGIDQRYFPAAGRYTIFVEVGTGLPWAIQLDK